MIIILITVVIVTDDLNLTLQHVHAAVLNFDQLIKDRLHTA